MTRRNDAQHAFSIYVTKTASEHAAEARQKKEAEDRRVEELASEVTVKKVTPLRGRGTLFGCTSCRASQAQLRVEVQKAMRAERAGRKPDLHKIDLLKKEIKECDHLRACDREGME